MFFHDPTQRPFEEQANRNPNNGRTILSDCCSDGDGTDPSSFSWAHVYNTVQIFFCCLPRLEKGRLDETTNEQRLRNNF
jgi:hypothetical protein